MNLKHIKYNKRITGEDNKNFNFIIIKKKFPKKSYPKKLNEIKTILLFHVMNVFEE